MLRTISFLPASDLSHLNQHNGVQLMAPLEATINISCSSPKETHSVDLASNEQIEIKNDILKSSHSTVVKL